MMRAVWTVVRYEMKSLLTHPGTSGALLFLLLFGLYAIAYGVAEVEHQRRVIASFPTLQEQADEAYLKQRFGQSEAVGRLAYYFTQPTVHEPDEQAHLSLGVRDLHPYCLGIRLLGLRGQIYDSSLDNPQRLSAGNFDLSYVIIYLCPLLVIGLLYNLWSAEEEGGTLRMLVSTSTSSTLVLGVKGLTRFTLVILVVHALLLFGWRGEAHHAWRWILVVNTYLLFWFAVGLAVVTLRRGSSWNATALLAIWLMLTWVIPALANLLCVAFVPVEHGFEMSMQARQVMNEGWDKPRNDTYQAFLDRHSEWRAQCRPVLDSFSWGWYYAMHQVADDAVAEPARRYRDQLQLRQRVAELVGLVCPPIQAQLLLDRLAGTDLEAQLAYWDFVEAVHGGLQQRLYPRIFEDQELNPSAYRALRAELGVARCTSRAPDAFPWKGWLSMLGAAVLILLVRPALSPRS